MRFAREIRGSAFQGGSAVILARLVDEVDVLLDPVSVESAVYSISEMPAGEWEPRVVSLGHESVAIDVATAVLSTPAVSNGWDVDSVGYNFRHEIDTTTDPAFPSAGREYLLRYTLTRGGDQPVVFSARIKVI